MAKYKITGFPNQDVPKVTLSKVLGPVNRKMGNVEAEKGETVVTNMSRGLNNIYEMYGISGKKHSQGGTPLLLPTDDGGDTEGTSFIFSDNKKMIVKDPAILEYFGVDPKKPKTFADISKSWLSDINKSKQIIISDDADVIAKRSAEMSMSNASFKIAALKLLQESRKGFKDGIPNGMSPFFDKLQIDPNEMFSMNQADTDKTNQAVKSAMGGALSEAIALQEEYGFPSLAMGGQIPIYAGGGKVYKESELPQNAVINTSGKIYKVGEFVKQSDGTYRKVTKVNVNPTPNSGSVTATGPLKDWIAASPENKNAVDQANAIIEKALNSKPPTIQDLGNGKIKILGTFNPGFKERIILSRVLNQSGKDLATDKFQIVSQQATGPYSKPDPKNPKSIKGTGSFVAGFTPEDYEKRFVFEKIKASGLNDDEAFAEVDAIYKDPAKAKEVRKEYVSFLGIPTPAKDDELMSSDFYKKNYADITKGIEKKFSAAGYRPAIGDEGLSGFEHFDAFGFTSNPEFESNAPNIGPCPTCSDGSVPVRNADGTCPPCQQKSMTVNRLPQTKTLVNPYGFRREDLNSLSRAVQARFEIPVLHPWAKSSEVVMPDRAYYSPERAIAAKNEQLNQMMQGVSAFGNAQSAGATAMALSGQAYADVANTISDYADKNIGVFNTGEQYNTQLANARNERDAQLSTSLYDKENILKQSLANSISAAKDKITQLTNQAWTNASNIYNMNTLTENFKKDPFTGIITKMNDRDLTPNKDNSKDFGQEFNEFASAIPGVSDDLKMKAFLAYKSGKYTLEPDDQITKTNELNNTSYVS